MASKKPTKQQRTLHLVTSLDPEKDDERTAVSKKISWILRRGAKVAGVKMDEEGWVTMPDLLKAEILEGIDQTILMQVIIDSNGKKLRYELKDTGNGQQIRAYTKADRKARETAAGVSSKLDKDTDGKTLRKEATPFDPNEPGAAPATPNPSATPQPAAAAGFNGYPAPAAAAYPGYNSYPGGFYGYPGYNPYANQWAMNMAAAQAQHTAMAAAVRNQQQSMRYMGRVKSYNPDKGFGFIECHQTFQVYRRDVFLHKTVIGDTNVGDVVLFTCDVDARGMPQATTVEPYDPKFKGSWGQKTEKGKGKGKEGKGKDGKGKGKDGKGKDGKDGKGKDGKGKGKGKDKKGDSADAGDESGAEKKNKKKEGKGKKDDKKDEKTDGDADAKKEEDKSDAKDKEPEKKEESEEKKSD